MLDTKALSPEALLQITNSLNISMHSLVAVIGLLDEGGTVPFIARYRKEATGNLDEVQIRAIEEKLAYLRDLVSRRATILASIQEQGKLTDELKAKIEATFDRAESKICTSRTVRNAGRRRQSLATRASNSLPITSGISIPLPNRCTNSRQLSLAQRGKSPPSKTPSKAPATSWLSGSARTPSCES